MFRGLHWIILFSRWIGRIVLDIISSHCIAGLTLVGKELDVEHNLFPL